MSIEEETQAVEEPIVVAETPAEEIVVEPEDVTVPEETPEPVVEVKAASKKKNSPQFEAAELVEPTIEETPAAATPATPLAPGTKIALSYRS